MAPFTLTEAVWEDATLSLWRAVDDAGGSVLVKSCAPTQTREIRRFEHALELADRLDASWALVPRALDRGGGRVSLILDDFAGRPLASYLENPMALEDFFRIAPPLAAAVAKLHQRELVHGDLRPENILVDITASEVRLNGFGIALRLPRGQAIDPGPELEGAPEYMSPEQTGRMNRPLDHRTDFYSLGVLFYRLLTGVPPFQGKDPMEWVHAHLATHPAPPAQLRADIPGALSRIVMKLLSKTPEERYQTAAGLKADLELARDPLLTLGSRDMPDWLQLPHALYGRQSEIRALNDALERVVSGQGPRLALVSGESGSGKTSLIHELRPALAGARGFFAEGKCESVGSDAPLAPIIQALRGLLRQLLSASVTEAEFWRDRIAEAVGVSGQLVADLVPEMEWIAGKQPPVAPMPPQEAQNRFDWVFRRFVNVFAREKQPLVLFIDDLQWADCASLEWLKKLLTDPESRHVLLLGAFRIEEIGPGHALAKTLDEFSRQKAAVLTVALAPLDAPSLTSWLAAALRRAEPDVASLALLIHKKTGGNPFFARQFLERLAADGLLAFDRKDGLWRWDDAHIADSDVTANVAQIVADHIDDLPDEARQVLAWTAAMGSQADLRLIAKLSGLAPATLGPLVDLAIREGLALRSGDAVGFTHDRIQQAAYAIVPKRERAGRHLAIAHLLLEQNLYAAANHFHLALSLIEEPRERRRVAELLRAAATKAKASGAYSTAASYLADSLALLGPEGWAEDRDLAFGLHFDLAQCELSQARFDEAERLLRLLLERSRSRLERTLVQSVRIGLNTVRGDLPRAIEAGIACFSGFDISLAACPSPEAVLSAETELWRSLGERPIESLLNLPPASDPDIAAALDALSAFLPAAYFTNAGLHRLIACHMVRLCLRHGNAPASAMAYATFAFELCLAPERPHEAYRFGQVACELARRPDSSAYRAKVFNTMGIIVNSWTHSLRRSIDYSKQAVQAGIETGDLMFASYSAAQLPMALWLAGDPLDEVEREARLRITFLQKTGYGQLARLTWLVLRFVQALRGGEATTPEEAPSTAGLMPMAACIGEILNMHERYLKGDFPAARQASEAAGKIIWAVGGQMCQVQHVFLDALIWAAAPDAATAQALPAIEKRRRQLSSWAQDCPENFEHKLALVSAELARIKGDEGQAAMEYERAIQTARRHGFTSDEALACELSARFQQSRGFQTLALGCLSLARGAYLRWGALAQARRLEAAQPELRLSAAEPRITLQRLDTLAIAKASQAISGDIELESLLKTLMRLMLEHAGADSGCLLLAQDGGFKETARSEARTAGWPESIVRYVERSKESLVLADASTSPLAAQDAGYFSREKTKSVLCLPLLRQSKLAGVVYLENRQATGVFTPDRLAVLEILATQAAISLENARLFSQRRAAEEEIRRLNAGLEQRVAERTAELQSANKELETFSYSVSHDLKAPLRSILGFGEMLQAKYAGALDAKGREYLERVRAGGNRMSQLIEDLLSLSRVARGELRRDKVDLSAIAREISKNLRAGDPDRKVDFRIADGLAAEGDARLLRAALENLLGNAWKFTAKRPQARIEVGAVSGGFFVQDNGAGFEPSQARRLFQPFQRLHGADFEGSGIGLATVARIIARHGGQIAAEGAVGQGARFVVTLQEKAGSLPTSARSALNNANAGGSYPST